MFDIIKIKEIILFFLLDTRWNDKPPTLYWELSHVLLCGKTTGWIRDMHAHMDPHTLTDGEDLQWRLLWLMRYDSRGRLEICGQHGVCFVCARALYTSTCAFGAFLHMPPVTSSLLWTTNTGRFEVRLTRLCVWLSPPLSSLSNQELGGSQEGGGGRVGYLSLVLLSLSVQSTCHGKGGREGRGSTAALVL